MATYRVSVERDESGAWIAAVEGVHGAHTHGRSLRQVRTRVEEALSLWVDNANAADLEFQLHLPRDIRERLRRVSSARAAAAQAQRLSLEATAAAASHLVTDAGMSLRDAAELLGLSHQRLQQLLTRPARAARKPA